MKILALSFLLLFSCSQYCCQALMWQTSSNGDVPYKAVQYIPPYQKTSIHFCQVYDRKLAKAFTGTISEGEKVCQFVDTSNEKVRVSSDYEVLTLDKGDEVGWKWAYPKTVPINAVSCDDSVLGPSNCYLGVSMYSDGICQESSGKISPDEGLIHMSMDREYELCPFFMYLTVKEATRSVNLSANDQYVITV